MATDKWVARLEAKLDLLLEKAGMTEKQIEAAVAKQMTSILEGADRQPRKLTPQEQEAIDNAPKAEATIPPAGAAPRLTDQDAPGTKSSVPPAAEAKKSKGEGAR